MTNRPGIRDQVYAAVDGERDYQDAMQGNAARESVDANRSLGDFLTLTDVYLNKAKTAFAGPHPQGKVEALDQLRKAIALGVSAMEHHGIVERKQNAQ